MQCSSMRQTQLAKVPVAPADNDTVVTAEMTASSVQEQAPSAPQEMGWPGFAVAGASRNWRRYEEGPPWER